MLFNLFHCIIVDTTSFFNAVIIAIKEKLYQQTLFPEESLINL